MAVCLIGLGANLGDPADALGRAAAWLSDQKPAIQSYVQSSSYVSAPVGGPGGQNEYLNAAARFETTLSPKQLLAVLQQFEHECGRQRSTARWGPRVIDLDLLLYDGRVVNEPDLVVPHPRMATRRFVLEPAAEISASMVHPEIGWTMKQLLDHLNTSPHYFALTGLPETSRCELACRVAERTSIRLISDFLVDPHSSQDVQAPAVAGGDVARQRLLRRAAELDRSHWDLKDDAAISDYVIEQTLVYAQVQGDSIRQRSLEELYERLRWQIVQPKLRVLLEPVEQDASTVQSASDLNSALVRIVTRPNQGPWLRVNSNDLDWAVEEVCAAVQAMR